MIHQKITMSGIITLFGVSIACFIVTWCAGNTPQAAEQWPIAAKIQPTNNNPQNSKVCFEKQCRTVEIANDPVEQKQGLMNRQKMDKDAGMLFIFPKIAARPFWMKDTLISLDMIWMDRQRKIIHIEPDVKPCEADPCATYEPFSSEALYVLETNAGYSFKNGLKKGDQAEFMIKN